MPPLLKGQREKIGKNPVFSLAGLISEVDSSCKMAVEKTGSKEKQVFR